VGGIVEFRTKTGVGSIYVFKTEQGVTWDRKLIVGAFMKVTPEKKTEAHIRYKLSDGTQVGGVTSILGVLNKPALVFWANNLGLQGINVRAYTDDKADIGKLAHAMVTDYLSGKETDTSDYDIKQISAAENAALSYYEWEKQHTVKAIFVERPLVHESLRYGGTQDIYAYVDGEIELIDLKTGSGIYPEHIYQLAALGELLIHNHYDAPVRYRVLNIPRTDDESFLEKIPSKKELADGWQIFLACKTIYELTRKKP
jgi:RecB family exonuclease